MKAVDLLVLVTLLVVTGCSSTHIDYDARENRVTNIGRRIPCNGAIEVFRQYGYRSPSPEGWVWRCEESFGVYFKQRPTNPKTFSITGEEFYLTVKLDEMEFTELCDARGKVSVRGSYVYFNVKYRAGSKWRHLPVNGWHKIDSIDYGLVRTTGAPVIEK